MKEFPDGCIVPLTTSFRDNGQIDWDGQRKITEFMVSQPVAGVITGATMGETPALTREERILHIARTVDFSAGQVPVFANCGTSSTEETIWLIRQAVDLGVDGILLVDPPFSQPCSWAIREYYWRPVLERFPDVIFSAYALPGASASLLEAPDLALLAHQYPWLKAVKDGPGNEERLRSIRELAPPNFKIYIAPSAKIFAGMIDPDILANGAVAGPNLIVPNAIQSMCQYILDSRTDVSDAFQKEAEDINKAIMPLCERGGGQGDFKREEWINGRKGIVTDKIRQPVPIKTMMRALGMPVGPCRNLGRMPSAAVEQLRKTLRQVWEADPWLFEPIQEFFGVDIQARLDDTASGAN